MGNNIFDTKYVKAVLYRARNCGIDLYNLLHEHGLVRGKSLEKLPRCIKYPDRHDTPDVLNIIRLGIMEDGKKFEWDIQKNPNLEIYGYAGAGKTSFLDSVVSYLSKKDSHWNFHKIDLSMGEKHDDKKYNPEEDVATTIKNALALIEYLEKSMAERQASQEIEKSRLQSIVSFSPVMLSIDESYSLWTNDGIPYSSELQEEIKERLVNLLEHGHHVNMHVIMASQRPQTQWKMPVDAPQPLKIIMGPTDQQASHIVFNNDKAARSENFSGRGYFEVEGKGQMFQSYYG